MMPHGRPAWRALARRNTPHPLASARTVRALGALLAAAAVGSGCYRYAAVPLESVRPSESVQVRLTDAAATRLVNDFGTYTRVLEGPVAREGGDSVSVSVMIGREYNGVALDGTRQTLFLSRSEVVDVRRRELSRTRTVLASAGVVAAFAVLITTVVQMGEDGSDDGGTTPPPPLGSRAGVRIPFRIPSF